MERDSGMFCGRSTVSGLQTVLFPKESLHNVPIWPRSRSFQIQQNTLMSCQTTKLCELCEFHQRWARYPLRQHERVCGSWRQDQLRECNIRLCSCPSKVAQCPQTVRSSCPIFWFRLGDLRTEEMVNRNHLQGRTLESWLMSLIVLALLPLCLKVQKTMRIRQTLTKPCTKS